MIIEGVYVSGALALIGQKVTVAGRERLIGKDDHLVLDSVDVAMLDRGADFTITVEASADGGATWTTMGNVVMTSAATELQRRISEITVTNRIALRDSIQIRLRNITSGVPWGWIDLTAWVDIVGRKR